MNALFYDIAGCVDRLSRIVDQCCTTQRTQGGTVLTGGALYEIYVADRVDKVQEGHLSEKDDQDSTLEVRRVRRSKTDKSTNKDTKSKKPQQDCGKTNGKGQARKNGKDKKKGKKTIRDVLDDFVPQSPSSSEAGISCSLPDITKFYKEQELEQNRVIHYRFQKRTGWSDAVTAERVLAVLEKMKVDGKFDVIKMEKAATFCVGKSNGGTNPHDEAKKQGQYILANGGFFIMLTTTNMQSDVGGDPLDAKAYAYYSVGPASSTQNNVSIPPSQKEYYRKLQGDDGSFLWSGPKLESRLDLSQPELKYKGVYRRIPGGVATAKSPNERLVTAKLADGTKFLFAYTSDRNGGVNLNLMRELIKIFLENYEQVNIRSATQVLNLDGGGSIYVSWNKGGEEYVIAAGNIHGQTPETVPRPRTVTTMVKFSV
ncbi:hypothetical protein K504DRAFT_496246 [Pleomassaria siparia CBS 279.74]|uniref:Phosphodiester glycosidase domain-containing protein n=1 Tax=Pleomassaria siparia CBS 279.74 TaxID=1314801 RepID=A0A6G1KPA9_9PLEO|nr:hypothetical protein K504DRAFT_496246 [Pleomassaria siparia CBS 279.74]